MPLMNFIARSTPTISAAWLNVVDALKFTVFGDATTKPAARTALTSDAPLEIVNGGTGGRFADGSGITNLGGTPDFIGGVIFPRSASENTAGITPLHTQYPEGDVRRYGADRTGVVNSAPAIQQAIDVGTVSGVEIYIPSGTYTVVPATSVTGEFGAAATCMIMKSNMHIRADEGARLQISNGNSSAGAPARILMFFTDQVVSNISFIGLTMDMNGDNNQLTTTTSAGYTHSMICVSGTPGGVAANASDVLIQGCYFTNCAGTCCVILGQSNTAGLALGQRWIIKNNTFFNNGLYTYDHTNVYGWAENVLVDGNIFYETSMALDGKQTTPYLNCHSQVAYEVHGARQRIVNNTIRNYYQGFWLGGNYTNPTQHILFENNHIGPVRAVGIDTQRSSVSQPTMNNILIKGNTFEVTDDTTTITLKLAIQLSPIYSMSDCMVEGNYAIKNGNTIGSAFLKSSASAQAAQVIDRITIKDNQAQNFATGVQIATTATNGYGVVTIEGNVFHNTTAAGAVTVPCGVITSGAGQIGSIIITSNVFNITQYGIYMSAPAGSIYLGINEYITIATANYAEPGAPAISFKKGPGFGWNASALAAATIASANTIAPVQSIAFVSGVAVVKTITPPLVYAISGGQLTLIPTGLWTMDATGNIAIAVTAVVGKALTLTYDLGTLKWYPSYVA